MHYLENKIGAANIEVNSTGDHSAAITVSPLPSGYGTTLGNAFRRVLLSSLVGSAVTAIKVEGISHEYTTITGVVESGVDVLLNIKELRIKKEVEGPVVLKLNVKGREGEVTAADIECPTGVSVINVDQHIATLDSKKAELKIEMQVDEGVGFSPASDRKKLDFGWISVDAIYSPILTVRYEVDNARVGDMVDLDKLEIEIFTDGSIDPHDALMRASDILKYYYGLFNRATDESVNAEVMAAEIKAQPEIEEKPEETFTPVEILQLSPRTLNALVNGGISTIEELSKLTRKELGELKGFGKKAMDELLMSMQIKGVKLIDEIEG